MLRLVCDGAGGQAAGVRWCEGGMCGCLVLVWAWLWLRLACIDVRAPRQCCVCVVLGRVCVVEVDVVVAARRGAVRRGGGRVGGRSGKLSWVLRRIVPWDVPSQVRFKVILKRRRTGKKILYYIILNVELWD
ncbi:hypothetical protein M758_1G122700 [Ceratodon purpureus]|nr:hypothetical protein M758_1G122700 [Ceratodon purpureus]